MNLPWSFAGVVIFPDFFPAFSLFSNFFPYLFSWLFSRLFSRLLSPFFSRLFSRLFCDFFIDFFLEFFLEFFLDFFLDILWKATDPKLVTASDFLNIMDSKMTSSFAVPLVLTFALTTSTCDGVRLANYIPTLQEYRARCDYLIGSYFHLGLEYREILLFFCIQPRNQLKP